MIPEWQHRLTVSVLCTVCVVYSTHSNAYVYDACDVFCRFKSIFFLVIVAVAQMHKSARIQRITQIFTLHRCIRSRKCSGNLTG